MYEVQPSTAHLDLMVAKLPGCLRRTPRQSSCPPSSSPWSPLPSSTWSIGYAEGKKLPIKQSTDHLFNVHNVEHSRTLGDAKRISIFKSSAIVTCEGGLLQRVLLRYFLLSIFSPLNICTVRDWCMNASVPLNWTEASHWDRANMEGSRCSNINQPFVIFTLTSDFSECIYLIFRGHHNHEDI